VQPTHAFWEQKPASGKFPVVIHAPGFTSPAFDNSDLCEYLASNGYVVVASPGMGPGWRNMTDDIAGIQTQMADIEFLIGFVRNIPQADMSQIAVAGFSWARIFNIFAALRHRRDATAHSSSSAL
jgi:dienelactone hydrolase